MEKTKKELLQKELTRREFLAFLGVALLTLFGITNFLSFLTKFTNGTTHQDASRTDLSDRHGFGSRKFGT